MALSAPPPIQLGSYPNMIRVKVPNFFTPPYLAGGPVLVVHIADVSLQVRLQVAAVPAVSALEVLHLKYGTYIRW